MAERANQGVMGPCHLCHRMSEEARSWAEVFFFFFFFDSMNEAPKNVFGLINLRNSLKNDFGSQMYMIKEISTSVPERRWQQRCEKPRKRFL